MKKLILISTLALLVITYSCSKSSSSSESGCFTCKVQSQVVKYCQKNSNTATITYPGGSEEDNFENGWDKYVQETKEGARAAGHTCD